MTASTEARETALLAAQAAADKLATDVSIVDVSDRLAITDAFVLAAAPNERQVQAIVDEVEERLRAHGVKPVRREGVAEARWVLLDFVDVVVHVQHTEERAYYALERLWKDCPTIPFVDRALPATAATGGATLSADDVDPGSSDPLSLAPDPTEDLTEDDLADEDALEGDPMQDGHLDDGTAGSDGSDGSDVHGPGSATGDGDAGTTGR